MTTAEILINTSASDCEISANHLADSHPETAVSLVVETLRLLNARGVERKSHRKALIRAGKKAIAKLGEFS